MVFKDVKVKSIDQKSPYFYPARRIEITTSEKRIITPSRAATLYEYNKKSEIPTDIPFENEISVSLKKLNKNKLINFLKGNGLYSRWSKDMFDTSDTMKYSPFTAHIIQPTISNVKKKGKDGKTSVTESGVEYLRKNKSLRERFLRLIIKMQSDIGLDVITIPYLNLPLSEYEELVKSVTRELHRENKEPMFVFDLEYQKRGDKFEDAMKFLIDKAKSKLIAFPNKSFQNSAVSYDILSGYSEKEVAFVTFEVERAYKTGDTLSKMHSHPFIGHDIYAVKTPRYFPPADESVETAPYVKQKESIQFFNPDNLLIQSSTERIKNIPKILDEIDQKDNRWMKTILNDFEKIKTEQDEIYIIDAISKIHELKSSTAEFEEVKKRIKSEESTEYIKEQTYLSNRLSTLKKKKKKS